MNYFHRQLIFQIITVVSVITNAGLVVFTMDTLEFLSDSLRFWIFILFQWVCFALQVSLIEVFAMVGIISVVIGIDNDSCP